MNEEFALASVDRMPLNLAGVVRDIKQKLQVATGEEVGKNPACVMAENFAVGQRTVNCCAHCSEITGADLRVDRSAGEFSVAKLDARGFGRQQHFLEEFCANLVAKPARAAMDGNDNVVERQFEGLSYFVVEDFCNQLDLEVMVARTERSHLAALSFSRAFGDVCGPGARDPAALLNAFEVTRLSPATLDGP